MMATPFDSLTGPAASEGSLMAFLGRPTEAEFERRATAQKTHSVEMVTRAIASRVTSGGMSMEKALLDVAQSTLGFQGLSTEEVAEIPALLQQELEVRTVGRQVTTTDPRTGETKVQATAPTEQTQKLEELGALLSDANPAVAQAAQRGLAAFGAGTPLSQSDAAIIRAASLGQGKDIKTGDPLVDGLSPLALNELAAFYTAGPGVVKVQAPGTEGGVFETKAGALGQPAQPTSALVDVNLGAKGSVALLEAEAETISELGVSAGKATRRVSELNLIQKMIRQGDFDTGFAAGPRAAIGRFARFIGLGEVETNRLIGSSSAADALTGLFTSLVVEEAEKLSRPTNFSLALIKSAFPELAKTKEGNLILVEVIRAADDRTVEENRVAQALGAERLTDKPIIDTLSQRLAPIQSKPLFTIEQENRMLELARAQTDGVDVGAELVALAEELSGGISKTSRFSTMTDNELLTLDVTTLTNDEFGAYISEVEARGKER